MVPVDEWEAASQSRIGTNFGCTRCVKKTNSDGTEFNFWHDVKNNFFLNSNFKIDILNNTFCKIIFCVHVSERLVFS